MKSINDLVERAQVVIVGSTPATQTRASLDLLVEPRPARVRLALVE